MHRILLTLGLLACATTATATLVEVPDDYLMMDPSLVGGDPLVADMVQSETAPHPVADRTALVWTFDIGTGPRDIYLGVLDANTPTGEALVQLDDTEALIRDPAVAYDDGSGKWLVVWAQEHVPGAWEIYGRLVYPDGTMNPAPVRISFTGVDDLDPAFDALQPAVSSNEAGTFLVAWVADDDAYGAADGDMGIYHRTVLALNAKLGPVSAYTQLPAGLAALQPELGYLAVLDDWFMVWEQDQDADPAIYAPQIFGNYVFGTGAPRATGAPIALAETLGGSPGARRALGATRNPAIVVDRLNQHLGICWDETFTGAATAQRILAGVWDADIMNLAFEYVANLDAGGYLPSAWVRDPAITHNRISGSFAVGWRESLNPDGSGQTLKILEYTAAGVVTPAFAFVNQPPTGFAEFGPPHLEGGWRTNGRLVAIWESDAGTSGYMQNFGQNFDLGAVTDAPEAKAPEAFGVRIAPNPFNPRTEIALALPVAGRARVDIYDVRGRLVRRLVDESLAAGTYSRTWEGLDDGGQRVSSGVYLVKVQHPAGQRVTKVSLVE
jgi:hypothetical protein